MKNRFLLLGAVVALVVVLWSGAWLVISGMVKDRIAALADTDGVTIPKIACADLGVGGYPFRFDVTCTGADIASGDILVSFDELRATVRVYRPTHALLFAHSPARITDTFSGAVRELRWTDLEASIRLDGWRLARASLIAENLGLFDTLVDETQIASATGFQFHLLDMPERFDGEAKTQSIALYEQITDLNIPSSNIEDGMWETEAEINAVPADVRLWNQPDLLQNWQAMGGTLELVSLTATDTGRSLEASGRFNLSEAGKLNGQLSLTSNGLVEEFGDLLPEAYRNVLFSEPAEDGSYANTIHFINGIATAGLLPVGVVPALY